jgi:hypothetical protein
MKTAIALTAAGLISLGIVGTTPAAAYHLIPEGQSFVGDGTTSATKNGITLPCKAHFTGKVTANGVGYVTGGSFTDNGGTGCKQVKLVNLPYKSRVRSATKVVILNAKFNGPLTLDCGPSNVPTTLKNGVITFTAVPMAGGCSVSGKITTTPTLSIVP